jgi:mannose-1-phosphate guanylyltransferase
MSKVWVIVLAGGEGRRLSSLTRDASGTSLPKQYCSFGRDRPMVQWAIDRAISVAPPERIVTVVAREHRVWWERALEGLPPENIVVQPRNCGTAAGILLPLIEILRRDPDPTVVVLPSDHYVADEAALESAFALAIDEAERDPRRLVLLGITPDEVDAEYGWILPGRERSGTASAVEVFVEKPSATVAANLLLDGAVWNSFMFVAKGRAMLRLYGRALPDLLERFLRDLVVAPRPGVLDALYDGLDSHDFSRELLERVADELALVVVPPCGWSDLGTPTRLGRFLGRARALTALPA